MTALIEVDSRWGLSDAPLSSRYDVGSFEAA